MILERGRTVPFKARGRGVHGTYHETPSTRVRPLFPESALLYEFRPYRIFVPGGIASGGPVFCNPAGQ